MDEAKVILGTLKAAYPRTFADLKRDDASNMVMLWANMFADDDISIVRAAVEAYIATNDGAFPPSIGQIKAQIVKLTQPPEKSALEAWAEVKKALKNSLYGYIEEFKKLDSATQRIVGSPTQLKEWAQTDVERLDTVVASNFRESYKAVSKSQREYTMLPGPVADMVNAIAAAKTITPEPKQEQPKALPVSVDAIVSEVHEMVKGFGFTEMPPHMTDDEFEKKRAEILKSLEVAG